MGLEFIQRLLIELSIPFSKAVGKIHAPFSRKALHAKDFDEIFRLIEPGDVLLTRTRGELSTVFIPSHFCHGAVYVGNRKIVEALGDGVRFTDLIDFILTRDEVVVLRARFCGPDDRRAAAAIAAGYVGMPYDFNFNANDFSSLYCFEISYAAYEMVLGKENPWKLRKRLGIDSIVGDDFMNAPDKWRVLCHLPARKGNT